MDLKRCEWLIDTNPKSGNCFSTCMFIHGLADTLESLEETKFIHLLEYHFKRINPNKKNLIKGDILCMCYSSGSEISYQHAFLYWDEFTVFQRSGFEFDDKYEFCNIVNAVSKYSSKQVSKMCHYNDDFNNVKVVKFFDAHNLNCVYRRNTQSNCVLS
jgi:hypothetical protein